jgi:hypothetical protein
MATNYKRRLAERDPVRAAEDKAAFIAAADQTGPVTRATAMSELILGRPIPVEEHR